VVALRRIRKLLIANRGEIAVRIARTCRVLGVETVAVHSEADAGALHVRTCDEAIAIGPAEASRSYLDVTAIVDAARRSGADAVHPGYGFLSESAALAAAVCEAGLLYVGPPAAVHERMGDKKSARRLMAAAGVPVLPGYDGDEQSDQRLAAEAERIGWPVMLKPARGGGGKGMRVVRAGREFAQALEACRREARGSFGDDQMLLERFVERSRHVEVQVLADAHGHVLHLFERECSIQRRHQKLIEETPSPLLDDGARDALCAAGVEAARATGYVNAGTVEFLFDGPERFYFLEMNTRLQVEHPVTEAVTGLDLVRHQLEVAEGRELPFEQRDVAARGHALECRLYAEDPSRGDLPSPGTLLLLVPPEGPGVRFDSGVETGSEVSVHYDPMLAKLVTWGRERRESIQRMRAALASTVVLGVATNRERLHEILAHPEFEAGALHTGFVEEHLAPPPEPRAPPGEAVAAALAALQLAGGGSRGAGAAPARDPWGELGHWRLGAGAE
jgi:acetyl-CoA carboxylase biotin carboxylase subunit